MSGEPHEIVIIKRVSGGHEDEHHGGVWKIAFADFMTAMMAFFLVMWLISANDKTKAVIARYFNPVQLVDSTPQPKGLEDPKAGSPSVMPKSAIAAPEPKDKAEKQDSKTEPKRGDPTPISGQTVRHEDAELFKDPYAILAEIAGKNQVQPTRDQAKTVSEGQSGGSGAVGLKGGQAYRDPFEPLPMPPGTASGGATAITADSAAADLAAAASKGLDKASPWKGPEPKDGGATKEPEAPDATNSQPASLASKIEAVTKQSAGPSGLAAAPQVEVRRTPEGTVIDLTDGAHFAMFASASAEPSPKMVLLMEKIGGLLRTEKGRITIRGYTDNKPFRSDTYDNWRLSSARAHMAHYMLVRGGLDEQRIESVEGYADRRPKNPKDPGAAENRRIEILVRDGTP